jgi:hypothetical protein
VKLYKVTASVVVSFSVLAFNSTLAQADGISELPFLAKSSGSGFVAPDYRRYELCQMYVNKVEIRKQYAELITTETKELQLEGNFQALIEKAAKEKMISTPNGLCDGPATTVSLIMPDKNTVTLYSTGGCGTASVRREGPATSALRDMIDAYCPKTFEAPNPR